MHLSKVLTTTCALFSMASAATTYAVIVGEGNPPRFLPPYIDGVFLWDSIEFIFPPGVQNHSVTESAYPDNAPCTRSDRLGGMEITDTTGNLSIIIRTKVFSALRFWFYSRGESDCESGMVSAINPEGEANFLAFKKAAMGI